MLIQPKAELYGQIIKRINREEELVIFKRRLILESFGFFITFPAFIFLGWRLLADLADSGLMQFLSLLFSDFNIIIANLGDYVLGLLESAPALSLSLALVAMLALVFNLAKLADLYVDFKQGRIANYNKIT